MDVATASQAQDIQLKLGNPNERGLAGGETNYYQLSLIVGQCAEISFEQRGIEVLVNLYGPDGKLLYRFYPDRGDTKISWVAEETGSYRFEVMAKQRNAPAGRYEIQLLELRDAKENDRAYQEGRKLKRESGKLINEGKFKEALEPGERSLEILERVLGPDQQEVSDVLSNLAGVYASLGDYTKAEQTFRRALNIVEKKFGSEHLRVAEVLDNLAFFYISTGNFGEAEPNCQRSLNIREKALGKQHPDLLISIFTLGELYQNRRDTDKAISYYRRALSIGENLLGPVAPDLVPVLAALGLCYYEKEELANAEAFFNRALSIQQIATGPENPLVFKLLGFTAEVYRDMGEFEKAEPLFQRSIAGLEKTYGPEYYFVGINSTQLAILYLRSGEYAKAEPLFKRALAIFEKSLPADHPQLCEALYFQSLLYLAKGDTANALASLTRTSDIGERVFKQNLALGSERQKLGFLAYFAKYNVVDNTISLHSQAAPDNPEALNLAFTTLLRWKARVLDTMTDTIAALRRRAAPEDRLLFNKLSEMSSRLASFKLKESGADSDPSLTERVKKLETDVDDLEATLSARSAEFNLQAQSVTISAVQAALPANSALIDFAYYKPLDPKTQKNMPPHYLAYVLTAQGAPKWADLGEAAAIDRSIELWRETLRDPNRTDVKLLGRTVDEKVMRPLRPFLGDAHRLLVAPDGRLNLIPFDALIDEQNQPLIERYSISYLTSGRDLLRLQQPPQPSREGPLVVANPDFGRFATVAGRTDRGPGRARARLDLDQIFFQPLPGTEDEALAIKALLPKALVLKREQATETALKRVSGPRILHIATHGFFLDNNDVAPAESDPLRAANTTMAAETKAETKLDPLPANPYTVQLESTPEMAVAQEKVNGLRTRGLNAYIVKTEVQGKGTYFRVRAGSFKTQAEAQKYGAGLQQKGVVGEFFVARFEPPDRGLLEEVATTASEPQTNLRLSKFAIKVEDPLLRSGLALAGANQGKSGSDDGVLTAAEAAYLDLLGTKLVVLSACDTGVGEVKNGEGVQGLRRALVLAGSESQVMSLWPVSDEAARDLMIPYYRALRQGEGRREGLRQVQLRMLHGRKDQRHPFYWAAFIQSGEWANLDGKR